MRKIKSILVTILIGLIVFSCYPIGGISHAACAHLFNGGYTIIKEPTCTETGIKVGKCVKCGAVLSTLTIPALGHTYGGWTTQKNASCTISGFKMRTCSRCRTSQTQKIEATGHTFNGGYTITKAATCTTTGTKVGKCEKCKAVISTVTIPVLPHTYGGWTTQKNASCTISGFRMRTCSKCRTSQTQKIEATGHTFNGGYTVTKAATCTAAGTKVGKCIKCSAVLSTVSIPALGHAYGGWTTQLSASCTVPGFRIRKCTRSGCNTSETQPIAATGHVFNGGYSITKEPTCVEPGTKVGKCEKCSAVISTVSIPALGSSGHLFNGTFTVTKEPTCIGTGEKVGKCTICNGVLTTVSIPALGTSGEFGHNYRYERTVAPTDKRTGLEVGECTLCGKKAEPRTIEKVSESNYTCDLMPADANSQYGYVKFNGVKYPISISQSTNACSNEKTTIATINKDQTSFNFTKFISGFSLTSDYTDFSDAGAPKSGAVVLLIDLLGQVANNIERSYYSIFINESKDGSSREALIFIGSSSYEKAVEDFGTGEKFSFYHNNRASGGTGLGVNIIASDLYKAITGKDSGSELYDVEIILDPLREGTKYSENLYVNSKGEIVRHLLPYTNDKVYITKLNALTLGLTSDMVLDISYMCNPADNRFLFPLLR